MNKSSFTLAEILITLGIIGVVAALTLPNLISNYNKHVIETRLEKFYSIMNQAIKMAEVQYGDFGDWDNVTSISDAKAMENWWNKYLAQNVKTLKIETQPDKSLIVYLADGTKFKIFNHYGIGGTESSATHIFFYPKANNKTDINGKDYFVFFLHAETNKEWNVFAPYKFDWDGTRDGLINGPYGCNKHKDNSGRHYCTALIEYNGWKIPDDYPFGF